MTPERWARMKEIFGAALEMPEAERVAYLESACGDDAELRGQVERLLAQSERSSLRSPAAHFREHAAAELAPGEMLAHYRVEAKLGEGGMGAVYRAHDTRLRRPVALKVLPPGHFSDPDSKQRLMREARAASALNHPNIVTVYEISSDQEVDFIAMEYVEGRSLAQLIPPKGLPVKQALEYAVEIADALTQAHTAGVIHRDLKPANIMVTGTGHVKLLDFGLARRVRLAESKTTSLTAEGEVAGTPAYMSPEQARGEELDARTDLFSFGVVLYEMTTGQGPFRGDTPAVVFDATLNKVPVPPARLNPELPAEVERIIQKALEKDREVRYQHASELRADLKRLRRDLESGKTMPSANIASTGRSHGHKPRRFVRLAGTLSVLFGGLIATWFMVRGPQRLPDLKLQRLTANSAERPVLGAVISPDGKYLAWSDALGIHLTLIATGDAHVIAKPKTLAADDDWIPVAWFPDGTRLVANSLKPTPDGRRTTIWIVPALGGPASPLRDDGLAEAISPDGARIAFLSGGGNLDREIWVMGARGGDAHNIATAEGKSLFAHVHWSPHNQRIGDVRVVPQTGEYLIESRDVESRKSTVVLHGSGDPIDFCWLSSGRVVYPASEPPPNNQDANLWQVQVDPQTGRQQSKPGRITNWPSSSFYGFSVSADGKRIAFQKQSGQGNVYLGRRQAGGTRLESPRRLTVDEHVDFPSAWMPDSKAILFLSYRSGRGGIFKQPLDEESAEPVVLAPEDIFLARVSSDGSWILYLSQANGRLMRVPISGGAPQLVLEAKGTMNFDCARAPSTLCMILESSADLKELVFTSFDPVRGRGRELFRLPVEHDTDCGCFQSALAPDGSSVAIGEYLGKSIQLFSITGQHQRDITPKGLNKLGNLDWDLGSKALLVSSISQTGASLLRVDLAGNVQVLWTQNGSIGTFGIPSPDGRYLALGGGTSDRNVWMAEGF